MEASVAVAMGRREREGRFFLAYGILLLSIVLIGFAPSLFLRIAFENPPMPFYLHLHGAILTGWFVLLVTQASLIQVDSVSLHRRLGHFAAGYGAIGVAGGLMATLNVVSLDLSMGITFGVVMAEINPALGPALAFAIALSVFGSMISRSEFGLEFVRGIA